MEGENDSNLESIDEAPKSVEAEEDGDDDEIKTE
jgi:hypothetical protein